MDYIFQLKNNNTQQPVLNINKVNKLLQKKIQNRSSKIINKPVLKIKKSKCKKVYIISNIQSGGSKKYLDDITNHYNNVEFVLIINRKHLYNIFDYMPCDILFVQQLLFTDITPLDLLNIKDKYSLKIIISIHDFYWFTQKHNDNDFFQNAYLKKTLEINPNIIKLFENASKVIHPSNFTINHYNHYFSHDNIVLVEHNDILVDYTTKRIPKIINSTINIGNFQELSQYKGSENVIKLLNRYKYYKGFKINFVIVDKNIPKYTEDNWYNDIINYNLHCLLHLNKFGETYSYSLSKSINSGLPILYNNIGAFTQRIPKLAHYIKVIDEEKDYNNEILLFSKFEKMLDYIINNNGLFDKSNNNNKISYNEFYDFLFEENKYCSDVTVNIHNKIKPFAIYFPQFHNIQENNVNYYDGMTDIKNLNYFINKMKAPNEILDTPSLLDLNLSNILDYDLTNKNIITKQIEIAQKYGICGFAIYYYWFSVNSITNKNSIMENCYDLFFQENIDNFKVFFNWANEDWTNNPAFNTQEQILNKYDAVEFKKNIANLMKYFKHANYYKINNKPVFYIHHPFYISDNNILLFKRLLHAECINNGFDGIMLVMNNIVKNYDNNYNYTVHPNYKKSTTLNYEEYINKHLGNNNINTLFFDFNNSARMCNPNKLNIVRKFYNNSIYLQNKYIQKTLLQYNLDKNNKQNIDSEDIDSDDTKELNKTLLINSWNEWGENMAIEPGNINKHKYLLLLKSNLLSYV